MRPITRRLPAWTCRPAAPHAPQPGSPGASARLQTAVGRTSPLGVGRTERKELTSLPAPATNRHDPQPDFRAPHPRPGLCPRRCRDGARRPGAHRLGARGHRHRRMGVRGDHRDAARPHRLRGAGARRRSAATSISPSTPIDPEVNWVAKSLEGLQPVIAGGFYVYGSHEDGRRPPAADPDPHRRRRGLRHRPPRDHHRLPRSHRP